MTKHKIFPRLFLMFAAVLMLAFLPNGRAKAAKPALEILVKDGYTRQVVQFYYGRTPSGYMGYYADTPSLLVHPKSKKVTFSVKSSDGTCTGVSFQHATLPPSDSLKTNLMRFTARGRTRAYMFSVKKTSDPKVTSLKLTPSKGKKTFRPGGKRYLEVKAATDAEVEVKTDILIKNSSGQTVFYKKCKTAKGKSYTYRWGGKVSKDNELGLPKGFYVPAGVYKVSFRATMKMKKYEKTVVKTKKIRIL